jgi:hypothetical protein
LRVVKLNVCLSWLSSRRKFSLSAICMECIVTENRGVLKFI